MPEHELAFQVGERVIHWAYGLGEIIELDEKELFGRTNRYYVVRIRDITLWVPMNEKGEGCLRNLTPAKDFDRLFSILASPGEPLSPDGLERKNQLTARLKEGTLDAVCGVIRDLVFHQQTKKINDNEKNILTRATGFLLDEWSTVLSVPVDQAEHKLHELLKAGELPRAVG